MDEAQGRRQQLVYLCSALTVALTESRSWPPPGVIEPLPKAELSGAGGTAEGGNGYIYPGAVLTSQLLPNTFILIVTLHSLWDSNTTAIPPECGGILDMRRSDFAALLAGAGKHIRREMDPQQLWLDRSQLWLSTLRDAAYKILGQAAAQGILYKVEPLGEVLIGSLFSALLFMRKQHLRALLKTVVIPFIRYAPRTSNGLQLLTKPLSFFYNMVLEYLRRAWAEAMGRQSAPIGDRDGENMTELTEIVEDKLLGELCHVILQHLHGLLEAVSSTTSEDPQLGVMTQHVMATPELAQPVLEIIFEALTWPSSTVARQAAQALATSLPLLAEYPTIHLWLDGPLLKAAVLALSMHGEHEDVEGCLLQLICNAYTSAISLGMPNARATLLSLNIDGLNEISLGELDSNVCVALAERLVAASLEKIWEIVTV